MTTENKIAPTEMEESALDEISGGPHFRTWESSGDPASAERDKKTFSSTFTMGWDNVKN